MDETTELLKAVLARLEELSAEVKGLERIDHDEAIFDLKHRQA